MEPIRFYKKLQNDDLQARTGNEQNYQLAVGYQFVNDAFFALMKQGLTVLSIFIESAQPVILLLDAPTAEQLKPETQCRRIDTGGHPWIEYSAMVMRCKIVWRVPVLH